MSEENLQQGESKRDLMDGGFAVVDREKIIEEETRVITPWYMHFINVFFSPRKMMEENFYDDPPKGISIGVVGCILFTVCALLLAFANPLSKETVFDSYRMMGIAEDGLEQKYMLMQVGVVIGGVIGVFFMSLITAAVIQIAKLIAKDKVKFGMLYTIVLLSQMAGSAITAIDKLIAMFIPIEITVLGLPVLLGQEFLAANPILAVLAEIATLATVISVIILVIGYSVAARVSIKKSIIVIGSVEVFFIMVSVGIVYISLFIMQNMQIPM